MDYITTTQLRTKSSELVEALKRGGSVSLVHRSKVVAEIRPKKEPKPLTLVGPTYDFEDNVQLHSAAAAECDFFLTEDKNLLKLKFFGKLRLLMQLGKL